jgi:phosphoglycolate phosphatase
MALSSPRLLVFDLDGTLIDSRIDLTNSVNATLEYFGKQTLAEPTIAGYIGDGATALVRRALAHEHLIAEQPDPHDDAFVEQAVDWFIHYYMVHKLDYTYVYPGVLESLKKIRERHPEMPMAVLTNKPVRPSEAICKHFGLDRFFFANYGGNSFATKKPDPFGLLRLMGEASELTGLRIAPEETVMIGDSHVDVETAKACGARSVGCLFGLSPEGLRRAGADAMVESAWEWMDVLGLAEPK